MYQDKVNQNLGSMKTVLESSFTIWDSEEDAKMSGEKSFTPATGCLVILHEAR
jgi:hypothetical protein